MCGGGHPIKSGRVENGMAAFRRSDGLAAVRSALADSYTIGLFDLALDGGSRGCDLVKIKIGDVVFGAEVRT